jgi:pimeloyl-ACP methyl ester carboxylesterase
MGDRAAVGPVAAAGRVSRGSALRMETAASVAGHDRDCYAALRTALDHRDSVERLVVMDGVPIVEALDQPSANALSSTVPKRVIGCLDATSVASSRSAQSRTLNPAMLSTVPASGP